jgi:uncharacterized membrane protein YgdD (TMEM256/DUF423 family)
MRIAALTGVAAVLTFIAANSGLIEEPAAEHVRLGATVQFMHGMAVFSCATFMNIGARDARYAPAFFFLGMLLFSLPLYAAAWSGAAPYAPLEFAGILSFAVGWLTLAWSSRTIDLEA